MLKAAPQVFIFWVPNDVIITHLLPYIYRIKHFLNLKSTCKYFYQLLNEKMLEDRLYQWQFRNRFKLFKLLPGLKKRPELEINMMYYKWGYKWGKRFITTTKTEPYKDEFCEKFNVLVKMFWNVVELSEMYEITNVTGIHSFTVHIPVNDAESPYDGQTFRYEVICTKKYGWEPFQVRCQNPPFHPGYHESGFMCLSTFLADGWSITMTLEHAFLYIESLLAWPNGVIECLQDANNVDAEKLLKRDADEFFTVAVAATTKKRK